MLFDTERKQVVDAVRDALSGLSGLPLPDLIETLNEVKAVVHEAGPFKDEPVDLVTWEPADTVYANDYNPNAVAPPEMKLLAHSIMQDGYTQPIVAWKTDKGREVVDGFHRNRVGKENKQVRERVMGYLPVVSIKQSQQDRNDRIASTIRHNRARGKHKIDAMSDIVVELKRRNWTDERISRELGMDQDEILRLCQITGLSELFSDQEFSRSWDVEGHIDESDFEGIDDNVESYLDEVAGCRVVNTDDPDRIFHTHDKWECYKAGFYATTKPGTSKAECEDVYREFFADPDRFAEALEHVISEWKHSCEHYLTNSSMNRIAWLGQAACCYATGVPAVYRGGFSLLTEAEQDAANAVALEYLNKWLEANGRQPVSMEEAYSGTRQSDIY